MFAIGIAYVLIAGGMWFFLTPDPRDVGLDITAQEREWFATTSPVDSQGYQALPSPGSNAL